MQITSLNGWGGTLYEEAISYIQRTAPDILCLQEAIHSPATNEDWLTYRDGNHILPQRANFFSEIASVLPDHVGIFCPAVQGALWDGDQLIPSQSGIATYVHKSFPIIGQHQAFVHKEFVSDSYGEHPRPRNAHGIRIYDYEGDRAVSITHMHGLRDLKGKMDTAERRAQAQKFLQVSDHVSDKEDLKILCGDFNVETASKTLELFNQSGFTELVTNRGFETTRTSYYKKSGRFADYMLINREDEVLNFDVIRDPEVSDHCPLILEI